MPLITLTTDFGTKDFYTGVLKGTLHKLIANPTIIDITHNLKKHDTLGAAIILMNSIDHFPDGTIHIIDVGSDKGNSKNHLLVTYRNQYFIGSDNGVMSILSRNQEDEVFSISHLADNSKISFPSIAIYSQVAALLHSGKKPNEFSKSGDMDERKGLWQAQIRENIITGTIIYIDDYGNALSNINRSMIESLSNGRSFKILFSRYKQDPISTISKDYNDVEEGYIVALYNANGFLEIAVNQGNVSKLYGMSFQDPIKIEFNDNKNSENDLFA